MSHPGTDTAMLRTVYKYAVPVDDRHHFIPGNVVHVGRTTITERDDIIAVWAEVTLANDGEVSHSGARAYRIFGTGQSIPDGAVHVGTVQTTSFVWHLYDVTAAAE